MIRKKNLPKAKPRKLPQHVINSLNYRHGFHITNESEIAQLVAGKIAESMNTHKLNAVSRGQLKIHLNELDEWLKSPFDKNDPVQKELHADFLARRNALKKFLEENP